MSKDSFKVRYPPYLPFHYFVFLRLRKMYRQGMLRRDMKKARERGPVGIVDDGQAFFFDESKNELKEPVDHINKSALWMDEDLARPEIKKIVDEIEATKEFLKSKGLKYTATAASFVPRLYTEYSEKKNSWENAWCCYHSGVKPGHKVLDIGGASTAFNFYLAKQGCSVDIIDNDWNNVGINFNTNYVAKKMDWPIQAHDLAAGGKLAFPDNYFDRVFSICVIEHLTSQARRDLMNEIGRVLKPGGIASFSTDYDHEREVLVFDKGLRFAYRDKFEEDVIAPSGLKLMGNQDLIDAKPDENFLGAFFLKKEE